MKYCVLIMDGAADLPIPGRGQTCLELADTPNLDRMARSSALGMTHTVPNGMEPSSACACMSLLGYDPAVYYRGRAGIEAVSMGIPVAHGEVVFRCNLVTVVDGRMKDYSAGHISSEEAHQLVAALNDRLGSDGVRFYPGVNYRQMLKLSGREDTLGAECTPPHDIPGQPVSIYLPKGPGSPFLLDLMERSEIVLRDHPVNLARRSQGKDPATTIWLFWGTGSIPPTPPFHQTFGLKASMTSGVDLLRGLAQMMSMSILDIPGVNDGLDNDYSAQIDGALRSLNDNDLVVVHVEAPDEAGHSGSVEEKVEAIRRIDHAIVSRLLTWGKDLRVLVMPDHPTPIQTRTHSSDPVPVMMWGPGFKSNGASRFTEKEARRTGLILEPAYNIMRRFTTQSKPA
jgi:2,3-bisphosphoglycerate-independent phosphoglycerate mutase